MRPASSFSSPSLTLLVPGLLWPNPALQDTVFDLPLPALQTLLGRSRLQREALDEALWWQQLAGQTVAPAPFRLLGLGAETNHQPWLCADPVHLRFEQQTMVLEDPTKLSLSPAESAALAKTLIPLVEEFGTLQATSDKHWHLQPHGALPPCPTLISDLIGQPARALLPEGSEYRPWRRLFNEVQMSLHQHPVNQAREAAGQQVINSLALWGGGTLPTQPLNTPTFSEIQSDEGFHRGLAKHWNIAGVPLPQSFMHGPGHTLAVLPELLTPTRNRDAIGWREGLKTLEQHWFAPALEALQKGQLRSFVLVGFGDDNQRDTTLTATTHHFDKFKFWRRPRPLTELHP